MHITVLGSTGKVGQLIVTELLKRGHEVTAMVHNNAPFKETENLTIVKGDVHSSSDIKASLKNADAVISTLGSWGSPQKDVLSAAMENVIPSMQRQKINRIVTLTGAGIVLPGDKKVPLQILTYFGMNILVRKIVQDGRNHILQLQASGLDWTTLRSPVMDDEKTPAYLIDATPPKPWDKISRNSVARALCDLVETDMYLKNAPFIH